MVMSKGGYQLLFGTRYPVKRQFSDFSTRRNLGGMMYDYASREICDVGIALVPASAWCHWLLAVG